MHMCASVIIVNPYKTLFVQKTWWNIQIKQLNKNSKNIEKANISELRDVQRKNVANTVDMSSLKMLGLYLYTLIISHKSSTMLSILNKLTL